MFVFIRRAIFIAIFYCDKKNNVGIIGVGTSAVIFQRQPLVFKINKPFYYAIQSNNVKPSILLFEGLIHNL
ncbi:hypothetical protein E2986_11264 [Frieseomelitta varia]|uniref:Uncharacterized protein n=1 Tax=Frieseomelitta varia TaxID=561572 RepID=A0A833RVS4_9HYME|nr:hypothetical protein E2986_11264 [Frieseomelitta varia]